MRWLDGTTDAMNMNLGKLRDGEGQGGLACCSLWGREESVMTGRLNSKEEVQCANYLKSQRTSTNTA